MKTIQKALIAFALVITGNLVLSSCQKDDPIVDDSKYAVAPETNTETGTTTDCNLYNPADTIYPNEIDMLKYMREEEKLARDVYLTLFDLWQAPVFENISKSEQTHMDRILCLLEYYNIEDPASPEIGIFTNPDLQTLYDNLIAQGSASLVDALTVGATIEDVDIFDLEEDIAQTSNEAIITIFDNLMCGSRNHMRAFSGLLENEGVTYTPQYITQEEYDEIIAADHETCGNGGGNGGGHGHGH